MRKFTVPKYLLKYGIIALLVIAVGVGAFFVFRGIAQKNANHQALRGDVENVYYYLKQKSKDIYLFSNLKDGDSVALSAWHNTQSTISTQITNYEKMFANHQKHSTRFKESALIPAIQEYLNDFSKIASYISLRVSSPGEFSDDQYHSMKKELDEKLKTFAEKANAYKMDLR
ncbi:MAG: hypothetical protein PHX86_05650 [Caldisericia bacterium]|nr:hypothetical protein [Caldisericia bacterium]